MASSLTLPSLLPSTSFLIAYSLPLLLISLVLTFAGAFLTLDRTRRFQPRYDALPMPGMLAGKKEGTWIRELMVFEGGVGGMLLGYAFGLHLSTFLALIIPSTSSTESSLSSSAFLAVWLLSSISTAILGARYTLAALIFGGLSGGALFALGVCVMIHPGLTSRIIFTAVSMIILPISILLTTFIPPLLRFKHPLVRFASSATGAFGLTLSIALLASPSAGLSWASAWSHLSLSGSTSWGTSLEKGYSAVFCFLLILGSAADWFLWKQYGENPDEKWDGYLAEYAANLPNDKRRAGTFEPLKGFWAGLFGSKQVQSGNSKSLLFPLADIEMGSDFDADVKIPSSPLMSTPPAGKLRKSSYEKGFEPLTTDDPLPLYSSPPGVLKRGRKSRSKGSRTAARGFRKKEVVKFRPLDEVSESDTSSDEGSRTGLDALTRQRPWLRAMSSATSSTPTLVDSPSSAQHKSKITPTSSSRDDEELDYVKEVSLLKAAMKRRTETGTVSPGLSDGEAGSYPPDYSDFEEEDIVSAKTGGRVEQEKEWTPGFLQRHRPSASSHPSTSSPSAPAPVPTLPLLAPTALVPVPVTPSLIHALDRVEKARREAFSPPAASAHPVHRTEGLPGDDRERDGDETDTSEGRGQRWQEFWRDVKAVKGGMR